MTSQQLEHEVMNRVVRYERRRLRRWRSIFLGSLIVLFGAAVVLLVWIGQDLHEHESLKVLGIFTEDWSVIRQGWYDAFRSIWTDIPRHLSLEVALVVLIVLGVILGTRRQRAIQQRKRASIRDLSHGPRP